ncbi:MAG: MBL fold metallo-hydrolase [Deltaproteobacteria bacterium]|nr:MAG: MBL fold metallo-hydrolase [Deltaproteobacteria bacterium]
MDKVKIEQIPIGPFEVLTYIVSCGGKAAIIDPAGDEDRIIKIIEDSRLEPLYILNTHAHADHILGNKKLRDYFGIPVCMHEEEKRFFSDEEVRRQMEKELGIKTDFFVDKELKDGEILPLGDCNIEVIHTPGHSPGSVCFLIEKNLFTGDTLFVGAAGRTDIIGGSLDTLLSSLKKIIQLPADTVIWPGHDYGEKPYSTIAEEKEQNPYITDFLYE